MEHTPAQQQTATFVDALVQLAAVSGRPLSRLIDEHVADVPALFRQRLALGQAPAAILDHLAVMLAACAELRRT